MERAEAIMIMRNERPHCGEKMTFTEEEKCDAYDVAIEALSKPNYESDTEVRLAVTDRNKDKVVLWDAFGEQEYYPPTHGRLIDADALMEYCSNQKTKTISNNDIARFPTAQADRPHGEWIRTSNDWIDGTCGARYYPIHCSICNYSTYDDSATNFCPNCGTRMYKGGDDE